MRDVPIRRALYWLVVLASGDAHLAITVFVAPFLRSLIFLSSGEVVLCVNLSFRTLLLSTCRVISRLLWTLLQGAHPLKLFLALLHCLPRRLIFSGVHSLSPRHHCHFIISNALAQHFSRHFSSSLDAFAGSFGTFSGAATLLTTQAYIFWRSLPS